MALSVLSTVAGGVFNAFSFAGAGFLFQHLNKKDYQKETERHNKAMEKLTKAKQKFNEEETKRKNKVMKLRSELFDAKDNMEETEMAFKRLKKVLNQNSLPPPKLEDFYQPSDEMKKYQLMAVGILGGGSGWIIHKTLFR